MTYHEDQFNHATRAQFLKALSAEGVSLSPYIHHGLHKEPWIDHILGLNVYKKLFSPERLRQYREETACPNCDKVCQELVMLWASGPLLGSSADMDDVTNAIFKVHENRDKLPQV